MRGTPVIRQVARGAMGGNDTTFDRNPELLQDHYRIHHRRPVGRTSHHHTDDGIPRFSAFFAHITSPRIFTMCLLALYSPLT
jgi:hypothetical protein